jgi:hypothetical protein
MKKTKLEAFLFEINNTNKLEKPTQQKTPIQKNENKKKFSYNKNANKWVKNNNFNIGKVRASLSDKSKSQIRKIGELKLPWE